MLSHSIHVVESRCKLFTFGEGSPQRTSMDKSPNRPNRQSLRLPAYDYTSTGAYYITICAEKSEALFEKPKLRKQLLETWQALPDRFPGITLDEFVIMPNHMHGIIWLDGSVAHAPTLSQVVGAYKSLTTTAWLQYNKSIGTICSQHLWQRNYYDHIIRNDEDLEEKREYILNNPMKKQEREEG